MIYRIALSAALLLAPLARADDFPPKRVADAEKKFTGERKQLMDDTVRDLDKAHKKRVDKLDPVPRQDAIKKWEGPAGDKELFKEKMVLPPYSDYAGIGWKFADKLAKAYKPVAAAYEAEIKAAERKKDDAGVKALRARKEKYDDALFPGRKELKAGAVWEGTRYTNGNAVPFRVKITDLSGDNFEGEMANNFLVAGTPVFVVKGSVNGLQMAGKATAILGGKAQDAEFSGLFLGPTLLLKADIVTGKGMLAEGIAVLTKK